jgi:hypothetical protein
MASLSTVVAGLSTGLLLGLLVGLSSSPVVAALIGAVVTIASAILGLKDGAPADEHTSALRAAASRRRWGAAGLCLACIFGMFFGLSLRARDAFAAPPVMQVEAWTKAGYSPQEARAIVALRTAGLVPKDATVRAATPADAAHTSALFAGAADKCTDLDPDGYADAKNLRIAFTNAGGQWQAFAAGLRDVDPKFHALLLKNAWQLVCR